MITKEDILKAADRYLEQEVFGDLESDGVVEGRSDFLEGAQWALSEIEKKHLAEIEALKTKYKELESYIENILLPADKIKIVKIKDSMPQCFRCGYVKSDFEGDYKGTDYQIDQYQAEIDRLKAEREKLVGVVKFYADTNNWESVLDESYDTVNGVVNIEDVERFSAVNIETIRGGKLARKVLKEIRE